jgi:Yip1 domain
MRGDDEQTRGEPSDEQSHGTPPLPPGRPMPPSPDFDAVPGPQAGASGAAPGAWRSDEGAGASPAPTPAPAAPPPPAGGWEAGGAQPPPPNAPRLPWEDRRRHGAIPALFMTIALLIGSPGKAFTLAQKKGDYASPILFAVIVGWFGYVAERFWTLVMHWSYVFFFLPEPLKEQLGDVTDSTVGGSILGFALGFIFFPLLAVITLFVSSAVLHLFLMLFDALRHSRAGFEGTVRAVAYSSVASLGYFIPFAGTLIVIVAAIALETVGAAALHDTSKGRALAAVVVPAALCCTCVFLFAVTIVAILGMVFAGTGV